MVLYLLEGGLWGSSVAKSNQKERGQGMFSHVLVTTKTSLLAMLLVWYVHLVAIYVVWQLEGKPHFKQQAFSYKIKYYTICLCYLYKFIS